MPNHRLRFTVGPNDRDDVVADRFAVEVIPFDIGLREAKELLLLRSINGFFGSNKCFIFARLHFNKDQRAIFRERDKIEFSAGNFIIAMQDAVALLFEKSGSCIFTTRS